MLRSLRTPTYLCLAVLTWVCVQDASPVFGQPRAVTPVTDAELQDPHPDDWLMWRRTLDSWGYSPLDQITRDNVGTIRMVWTRGLTAGLQQGTPLVRDGVLFRALDQETGEVLWEINLGSGVTGFPISYAVDGTQYVAVSTGTSITTAAFGMLTPELRPSAGNTLFVFALPGSRQ